MDSETSPAVQTTNGRERLLLVIDRRSSKAKGKIGRNRANRLLLVRVVVHKLDSVGRACSEEDFEGAQSLRREGSNQSKHLNISRAECRLVRLC